MSKEKGRVLETIVALAGKVDPQLEKAMNDVQKKLDGVNIKAVAVGAAIGTAFAVGVTKATGYMMELGDSYNSALNDIQARTGATAAEMEMFGDVMQNVYKANYGESFSEVADGVAKINQVTQLAGQDLQDVTEAAFALSDTFGYEISESARAAKAMMTNFGVSGEEAMNMIAAGAQNGLDYSGELIDSINEYSVQFAKLGFTAEDMFKIYQAGAESGAWNLDKMGDAIKEFSIRSIDGSDSTKTAFETLGYDAAEMMHIFTKGGDEATGAFHQVINDLMDMEDHVARDAAGVQLFGTMWEDLGTDAMQSLADMQAGAYVTGEELAGIQEVKYDNLKDVFKSITRQLEVGLLPAASALANEFTDAGPDIAAAMDVVVPVLVDISDTLFPLIGTVISFGADGIAFLAENMDILVPVVAGLTTTLGAYKVASLLSAAATTTGTGAMTLSTVASGAWTTASGIATTATTALGTAFRFMTGPLGLVITAIGAAVAIGIALYKNWDTVKETMGSIMDAIGAKVQSTFTALVGFVKTPVNTIIGMVNSVVDKVNGAGFTVPDWVPVIGGKGFSVNIPTIPMLAAGGFTNGVSIAGEAGTEAVISFDPAYRSENLSYWAQAGRMLGVDEGYGLPGGSTTKTVVSLGGVSFAPNITVQGNADKNDIIKAIREAYPEFLDMLEEWFDGRGDFAYE